MDTKPVRAYTELCSNYGGIRQRWLVIYTQATHRRVEQSVNRQHLKQSQSEYKAFEALSRQFLRVQLTRN